MVNKQNGLVRFRQSNYGTTYDREYGADDYGRMRTGRDFIIATMKQTLKPENIFKIKSILEIMHSNITTNVSLNIAKDYIPYIVKFDQENIQSEQLPGESELHNGVWLFIHEKE